MKVGIVHDVHDKVAAYSEWLTETDLPKLRLYARPDSIIQDGDVQYVEGNVTTTTMVELGEGLHYPQEDHPHRIGEEIFSWYTSL